MLAFINPPVRIPFWLKIGILICYDVEFPELARVATERGARIIFVPFCTDSRQGYLRVRYCGQARAIESPAVGVVRDETGQGQENQPGHDYQCDSAVPAGHGLQAAGLVNGHGCPSAARRSSNSARRTCLFRASTDIVAPVMPSTS